MREDIISKARREQSDLADILSDQLFNELKPYVANGELQGLEGYMVFWDEGFDYDHDAFEASLESELKRNTLSGITGYTDWLLSRIVRKDDYSVPALDEIDCKAIQEKYDVPPALLQRVIGYVHSQEEMPLLGKISYGRFHPDSKEFQQWKDRFTGHYF